MNDYEKQTQECFKKHGITMKIGSAKYGPCDWDGGHNHYSYPVTLSKDGKSMRIMFIQSRTAGSTPPTEYDVVSVLTMSDPGSFKNFCEELGYDINSRKDENTYKAVKRQWKSLVRVFGEGECLEDLRKVEQGIGIRIR